MPRPRSGSESWLCLSLAVQPGAPSLSLCLSFLFYKGGMVTSICRVTGKCPAYCKHSINGSCHQSLRREEFCRLWEVLKTPGRPCCCPSNLGHPASGVQGDSKSQWKCRFPESSGAPGSSKPAGVHAPLPQTPASTLSTANVLPDFPNTQRDKVACPSQPVSLEPHRP